MQKSKSFRLARSDSQQHLSFPRKAIDIVNGFCYYTEALDGDYPHQIAAVDKILRLDGRAGLFAEMGTGKTRIALRFLQRVNARKVLIVTPLSVASVWHNLDSDVPGEIQKLNLDVQAEKLVYGSMADRAELFRTTVKRSNPHQYFIINYDSYWRSPVSNLIERWKPDYLVLDEAHRIKNRTTRQSRFAHKLMRKAESRLALTGTPIANGIQDLFSIFLFINPEVFGRRWADFAQEYLTFGGYQGYQIVSYRNEDKARQLVEENSFQISKAALNLPPRQDIVIPVQLSKETRARYEEFRAAAIMEIETKDEFGQPKTAIVIARIVLTTVLRLQQIVNGFATADDKSVIEFSNEKVSACADLTADAVVEGHQVVIFCRFLHDIQKLLEALPGSKAIHGALNQKQRDTLMREFRVGNLRILICQIQVASLGIDLTAADIGIFFSTGYNLIDFLQAKDRLHRPGQTKPVTYYHIQAERSVEQKVYRALSNKLSIASQVVDLDYVRALLS